MLLRRYIKIAALCLSLAVVLFARERAHAAGPLFAAVSGTGSSCTQSAPCALATAVSVAAAGSTIYIGAGTFTGSGSEVVLITKSLTLQGGWDGAASGGPVADPVAYVTRLTGGGARRVIRIEGATITAALRGLTIDRGTPAVSAVGGGLYINQASSVTIDQCIFRDNAAPDQYGGAIYVFAVDELAIQNSLFADNTATHGGAAIELHTVPDALIGGSRFERNLSNYGTVVELQHSVLDFFYNAALDNTNSNLLVSDSDSRLIMISSLVAPAAGATGVDVMSGRLTAFNSTFAGASDGAAIALAGTTSGTTAIRNNILANWAESIYLSGTATIDHNMFFGNTHDSNPGTDVVSGDPCFIDPASDNYRLGACSAALDAGANTGIIMDLDGNPRPIGAGYDLGAYERLLNAFLPLVMRQ